jgi:deoxyadenosine/deoxycytidine kinase
MIERPIIVYLSGNNASGKTTLGRLLAHELNWLHLPVEKFDQSYLEDLFSFERRWSFEAQLHFLSHKIGTINSCLTEQRNAFIDRSPHEDSQVFAEHFALSGNMDSRAIRTYRQVAEQFLASIPQPDLFIYCYAPLDVLESRVSARQRKYETHYPKNHLELLDLRYRSWLTNIIRMFPGKVLSLDTSKCDLVENPSIVSQLAYEVISHLEMTCFPSDQILALQTSLFTVEQNPSQLPLSLPCGLTGATLELPSVQSQHPLLENPPDALTQLPRRIHKRTADILAKRAYLAAPFTTRANPPLEVNAQPGTTLPGIDLAALEPHGTIPVAYREELLAIEAIVKGCGYLTTLPHRDVNRWGEKVLAPRQALQECTQEIRRSDVLIADVSFGVHYEVGVAAGIGIPIVLLCKDKQQLTFLMQGMESLPHTAIITYQYLYDLDVKLRDKLQHIFPG